MRRLAVLAVAATCLAIAAPAVGQTPAPAQPPAAQPTPAPAAPQQPPAVQTPKPYTPIPVTVAAPPADPSFAAFRKQLGDVAAKKDRAGLAKLIVAKDFFWETESGDKADKKKPGIDNLGAALGGFAGQDAAGWETLEAAAAEPSVEPYGDKKNVVCAPAAPQFDEQAFEKVIQDTGTEAGEWGFPVAQGVEVRASAAANAAVVDKLAMALVRILPDEAATQEAPFVRIVTPAGKTGYVPLDAVAALVSDQICYAKDASGWKITGYVGGE